MSQQPGGFDFEQLRRMLEQMGLGGDMEALMQQLQRFQSAGGGVGFAMSATPSDPDAAWRTTITRAAQLAGGSSVGEADNQLADAERLAQSWLDQHTTFSASGLPPEQLSRAEWLEATGERWRELVQPIIDGLGDALQRGAEAEAQPELGAFTSMMEPMMRASASLLYRERLATVLAGVASSTVSGTEVGINLFSRPVVALLPENVTDLTRDLDTSPDDVRLHLLVREAARQRLFHQVSWLSPQLTALMAHYAREISIDFESILGSIDPSRLTEVSMEELMQMGEEVRGRFFKPASTPEQLEILGRLETLLALIEGWVDHVTARATAPWMPNAPQLAEVIRRRRGTGGPTQRVFADLLGLELRPRLVRDAENLWAAIEHQGDVQSRDEVWSHPDVLPTAEHLAEPLSYQPGEPTPAAGDDDLDSELRKLLDDESS